MFTFRHIFASGFSTGTGITGGGGGSTMGVEFLPVLLDFLALLGAGVPLLLLLRLVDPGGLPNLFRPRLSLGTGSGSSTSSSFSPENNNYKLLTLLYKYIRSNFSNMC